jgi:hypothetical protein
MYRSSRPSRGVLIRDLLILQVKLAIDGLKDVVLFPLASAAVIFDVLFGRPGRPLVFYRLLRLGERFDLWINLYGAANDAAESDDGLFGTSTAGSNSLLGRLEQVARQRAEEFRSSPGPG